MNKTFLMIMALGVIFLVGCSASLPDSPEQQDGSSDGKVKNLAQATEEDIKTLPDGTKYILHPKNILSGGPPKDGIPSLDDPRFTTVEHGDRYLEDDDLVLGLFYKGEAKAYPHRILNWHEIVNDKVGDDLILITYCPLCRTGIAFRPIVNGKQVEFGTSGKLYNSELVMYDRLTDSYWPQSLGKAVIGESTGQVLEKIPLDTVMWGDWKKLHPDTLVLSKSTGFIRDYDRNPYSGIQKSERVSFPLSNTDSRLKSKVIVYGVEFDGNAKAYTEDDVKTEKVINDAVGGVPIVVVWYNELNTARIFERSFEGETLRFSLEGNEIKDENGNLWTVQDMIDKLEIADTFGHFWFSWASFFPETGLYGQ